MPPLTRRALLVGAAASTAATATGCTAEPAPAPPPPPDPDLALRAAAVAREQRLLAAYDAALAAGPSALLAAVREEHVAHLSALQGEPAPGTAAPGTTAAAPGTAAPGTTAAAPSTAPPVAPDLAGLEREAAAAHTAAVPVASRELAGLLASLAASEASHLLVL